MQKLTGALIVGALTIASYSAKNGTPSNSNASKPLTQKGQQAANNKNGGSQKPKPDHVTTRCDAGTNPVQCLIDEFSGKRIGANKQLDFGTYTPDFVIATVPDPVHTDLALGFDRFTEAIQQGATEAGYVFDRALVPWTSPGNSQGSEETKTENSSKPPAISEQERENSPGLLIFRKQGRDVRDNPLFMFLVGEAPTSGIHKEQFKRVLDIVREKQPLDQPVKILGPTFSGSFQSLLALITDEKAGEKHFQSFRIRSGTVMSASAIDWFLVNKCDKNIDFASFKDTDAYQIDQFIKFVIDDRGYEQTDIALISEDETALGNLTSKPGQLADKYPDLLRIYFPREISQLRNAYQDDPALSQNAAQPDGPQSRLKLNLDSEGTNDDSVPSYAKQQTPLSQEAVLLGIVTVLKVYNPKFVLLRATDPKDLLFLTRFLRNNIPQNRIVTLGADQLFPRDINDTVFRGVLSLTNYPLLPRQLTNFASPQVHRVFASTENAGLFNATMDILRPEIHDEMIPPNPHFFEYTPPVFNNRDLEEIKGLKKKPMVWLTVMGDDGYWPFMALSAHGKDNSQLRECPDCDSPTPIQLQPSPLNALVIIGLSIVAWIFIYLSWKGSFLSHSSMAQQFAMMTDLPRSLLLGASALLLIFSLAILNSPFLLPSSMSSAEADLWPFLIITTVASLIVSTSKNLWKRSQVPGAIIFALCAIALCYPLLRTMKAEYKIAESITLYRTAWLQSGVSPALPLLLICAAMFSCAWYLLKIRGLFDLRYPWLPNEKGLPANGSPDEYLKLIRVSLSFIGLAALLVAVVVIHQFSPQSLEGKIYDICYLALFLLCLILISNSIICACYSWKACRALLVQINRTPLRWAFRRMEGFSWKPLWGLAGGDMVNAYKPLMRSLESLGHLRASFQLSGYNGWKKTLEEYDAQVQLRVNRLQAILHDPKPAKLKNHHNRLLRNMAVLQQNLANMCDQVWKCVLKSAWASDTGLVTSASGRQQEQSETSSDCRVVLAEEFVALIYLNFIHRVLLRIRWFLLSAASIYVLLLFSARFYPFEPKSDIDGVFILLFIGILFVAAMIYGQMHRDSILSHLTNTTPGELGGDFWIRILSFGAVPLFSLLATQAAWFSRLFSWLKPILDALHK